MTNYGQALFLSCVPSAYVWNFVHFDEDACHTQKVIVIFYPCFLITLCKKCERIALILHGEFEIKGLRGENYEGCICIYHICAKIRKTVHTICYFTLHSFCFKRRLFPAFSSSDDG